MRSTRLSLIVPAALALAILVSGPTPADAQTRGGTLRVAYGNDILGMDFHTLPGYEMLWVVSNIGCGLIRLTPDPSAETPHASSEGPRLVSRNRRIGFLLGRVIEEALDAYMRYGVQPIRPRRAARA